MYSLPSLEIFTDPKSFMSFSSIPSTIEYVSRVFQNLSSILSSIDNGNFFTTSLRKTFLLPEK